MDMPSPVTVRPAVAADRDTIGRLGALLVVEHHEFDPQRFILPAANMAGRYGDFLVSQISKPEKLVLVAEQAGDVTGYAFSGMEGFDYLNLRGPAAVLYDLVVDPDHRRQGIGKSLLEATFAALQGRGAPRVLLFTAEKNHSAQAVFERAGFRRTMIEMTRELG
jgi:ribosomal protein S18 acetylase RimI-like enzyme